METLNLVKGERVDLTKTNPNLEIASVGLGWDVNRGSGAAFDLDAFAMILKGGKLTSTSDVVYFGNKQASGVEHSGDNLTGQGDGDDETIKVTLANLPADATDVLFAVNIYQASERRQNFGMVSNAFIRIYNGATSEEILKYDLSEDSSSFNAYVLGKLYKKDGEWKFQAIGEGKNGDINEIAQQFK